MSSSLKIKKLENLLYSPIANQQSLPIFSSHEVVLY